MGLLKAARWRAPGQLAPNGRLATCKDVTAWLSSTLRTRLVHHAVDCEFPPIYHTKSLVLGGYPQISHLTARPATRSHDEMLDNRSSDIYEELVRLSKYAAYLKPIPESQTELIFSIVKAAIEAAEEETIIPTLHYGICLTQAEIAHIVSNQLKEKAQTRIRDADIDTIHPGAKSMIISWALDEAFKEEGNPHSFVANPAVAGDFHTTIYVLCTIGPKNRDRPSLDQYRASIELFRQVTGTNQREPRWHWGAEHSPE
ncbi:hypothetical protein ACG7TL_003272 [Trametes sanguinea]